MKRLLAAILICSTLFLTTPIVQKSSEAHAGASILAGATGAMVFGMSASALLGAAGLSGLISLPGVIPPILILSFCYHGCKDIGSKILMGAGIVISAAAGLVMWGGIILLDENSNNLQFNELINQEKYLFNLTDNELNSFNENREEINLTFSSIQQEVMNMSNPTLNDLTEVWSAHEEALPKSAYRALVKVAGKLGSELVKIK